MDSIKFGYLYRDGSNFKSWGNVVFFNPENLSPEQVTKALEDAFETDGLFIAHQIRIPEVFLYGKGDANADDHCYHEFDAVEKTTEAPSDRCNRSIGQFVAEVQREAGRGWLPFEPFDKLLQGS